MTRLSAPLLAVILLAPPAAEAGPLSTLLKALLKAGDDVGARAVTRAPRRGAVRQEADDLAQGIDRALARCLEAARSDGDRRRCGDRRQEPPP